MLALQRGERLRSEAALIPLPSSPKPLAALQLCPPTVCSGAAEATRAAGFGSCLKSESQSIDRCRLQRLGMCSRVVWVTGVHPGVLSSNPVSLAEAGETSCPSPRQTPAARSAEPPPPACTPASPAVPKKEKPLEDGESRKVLTKGPRAELVGAPEAVTCESLPPQRHVQLRTPLGAHPSGCCRVVSNRAH